MIVFHALNEQNIHDITAMLVRALEKRLNEQTGIKLTVTDEVIDFVAKKGFDKDYGARPIRRALTTHIEDTLAEALLSGEISHGDEVTTELADDKVTVKRSDT